MKELEKQTHETLDDYAMRLYFTEKDKHGLSREDIAYRLNIASGLSKDESAWRKHYASFKKGMDYSLEKGATSEQLEEIQAAIYEAKKQTEKMRAERVLINRKVRQISRTEMIYEQILEEIPNMGIKRDPIVFNESSNVKGCIMALSDLHIGAKDGEFNHEKLLEKFDKILETSIPLLKKENVQELNLLLCGDYIDGLLRVSQLRKIEFMIGTQIVKALDLLYYFIDALSEHFNIKVHMTTFGNHAQLRSFGTGRNELDEDDIELAMRELLDRMLFHNERVEVIHYKDLVDFELANHRILALHGSEFDKRIEESFVKDISYDRNTKYDVMYVGHFHRFGIKTVAENKETGRGVELIHIPAVTFTNDYAARKLLSSPSGYVLDFYYDGLHRRTERIYI